MWNHGNPSTYYQQGLEPPFLDEIYNQLSKFDPDSGARSNTRILEYNANERLQETMLSPSSAAIAGEGCRDIQTEPISFLEEIFARRRSERDFSGKRLTEAELDSLLRVYCPTVIDGWLPGRLVPTSGGLAGLEIYVGKCGPGGLFDACVLDPVNWKLLELPSKLVSWEQVGMFGTDITKSSDVIFIIGNYGRVRPKYGHRSYRLLHIEAGVCACAMQYVASHQNIKSYICTQFYDSEIEKFFNIDGVTQSLITSVVLGK